MRCGLDVAKSVSSCLHLNLPMPHARPSGFLAIYQARALVSVRIAAKLQATASFRATVFSTQQEAKSSPRFRCLLFCLMLVLLLAGSVRHRGVSHGSYAGLMICIVLGGCCYCPSMGTAEQIVLFERHSAQSPIQISAGVRAARCNTFAPLGNWHCFGSASGSLAWHQH